jgi:lysophospholipase L1-like esterase
MLHLLQRLSLTISILCIWSGNVYANDSDVVNCNKTWKIVVLGSSTAFGIGASEPDSSWVGKFTSYIKRRNQANEIINLSIPGYTTYQNLRPSGYTPPAGRPSPDPLNNITAALAQNPDAIIINIPSNDAVNNYTLSEQQENFEAALALADANNIPVWVTTSQPRSNITLQQTQNLEQLRDWIFLRFGNKAVDFWTDVANPDGSIVSFYDFDNVHVNNEGHRLFFLRMAAETILDSLCNRFTGTLVARAGNDQSIALPLNQVTLDGSASTSGGTITSYSWAKVSGPSSFTLTNSNQPITLLSNLIEGRYAFELTVTDDNLITQKDTVNIIVSSRILIDIGPTNTISPDAGGKFWNNFGDGLPGVKITNAVTVGNVATTIGLEIINRIDGTFNPAGPGTNTGNTAGIIGDYGNEATTDFAFAHPSATNGQWKITGLESNRQYTIKFWGTRTVPDDRVIEIKRADQSTWQEYDAKNNNNFNTAATFTFFGQTEMTFDIRAKTGSAFGHICLIDITETAIPVNGNIPPIARAGADITLTLPNNSTTLNGTASTDDDGSIDSYEWSKIAGPVDFLLGNPNASSTSLSNLTEGTYLFQLKVTDDQLVTDVDTVAVTVITRVLFDVGSILTNSPDLSGKYWNNVINALPGVKISNAVTTGNTVSGISLEIINRIDGTFNIAGPGVNGGNTVGDVGDYPNSATTDNAFSHPSATNGQWKIAGLNNTKSYTVKFWGTRGVADSRIIQIKRADETVYKQYNASNNSDFNRAAVFTLTGVTEMVFDIRTEVNSAFGHISVVDINVTIPPVLCTPVTPSVSITSDPAFPVCEGSSVSFVATAVNGGIDPSYQWFNGITPISGETGSTYTSNTLANGDQINVQLVSSEQCPSINNVNSNVITALITPNVPVSVSISANPGNIICSGSNISFTAIPVNGGTAPQYQWFNGITPISGETGSTYTSNTLANGDAISVQLTSSEACAINNPATSNTVNMTVNPLLPVSVSITSNPAVPVCAGTNIDFVANIINGGTLPQFQWKLNGFDIPGAINSTFNSSSLQNGDLISCVVISNAICTVGNPATSNVLVSVIKNPSTSLTTISICGNSYTWNGTTYIASGIYTFSTTNAAGCDSIATLNLNLSGNFVPDQITGSTNACSFMGDNGLIATYSVNAPGATSFVWNISQNATIVSGQGTNTIGVRYLSSFGSGSVIVTIGNPCGSPVTRSVLVTRATPAIPVAINGPLNVCNLVNSNGQATYSISPVANAITYRWTLPSTVTLLSATADSTSITVSFNPGFITGSDKSIRVRSISGCGNSGIRAVTLRADVPSAPTQINGQQNVCLFLNTGVNATYFINKISSATSYEWNIPSGAAIVDRPGFPGENDTVIVVNYDNTVVSGSQITVRGMSTCGTGNAAMLLITRNAPGNSSIISGPTAVCAFTIPSNPAVYFVHKTANASSYNWEVPAGAVVTHPNGLGENDTLIKVVFVSGLSSGNIRVTAVNGCGISAVKSLTVRSSAPSTPIITGPTEVCALIGVAPAVYKVNKVVGATEYVWGVPSVGATAIHPNPAGPEDTIILVTYYPSFVSGSITVSASGNCSNSSTRTLNLVRGLPSTPGLINTTAISTTCPIRRYSYAITALPANATSTLWTVPAGAVIDSGQGTLRIYVTYPITAISSPVAVVGTNGCGNSASSRRLNVSLPACAAPLARNISEPPRQQKISPLNQVEVSVIPNPSTNQFSLRIASANMGEWFSIKVTDINGKTIETRQRISAGQLLQIGNDYKQGIYFVTISGDVYRNTYKLVKL